MLPLSLLNARITCTQANLKIRLYSGEQEYRLNRVTQFPMSHGLIQLVTNKPYKIQNKDSCTENY